MTEQWFLLELGCAECGDMPLALPRGMYATADDAKAAAQAGFREGYAVRWVAHPAGGEFTQWGSGGYWIAQIDALSGPADVKFGSEYDEQYRGL